MERKELPEPRRRLRGIAEHLPPATLWRPLRASVSSHWRPSCANILPLPNMCRFSDASRNHEPSTHTAQASGRRERSGWPRRCKEGRGSKHLAAEGYGELKGAPVAASARHIGASRCFGRPWSRNGRATTARKPPAGVHGGDLELLISPQHLSRGKGITPPQKKLWSKLMAGTPRRLLQFRWARLMR